MKTTVRAGVLILGIAFAVAGCTPGAVARQTVTDDGQAVTSNIPTLLVNRVTSRAGDGAMIAGKLAVVNGMCFGLDNGTTVSTAIFPHGTSVVDSSTIRIPGAGTLKLGQMFTGAGGNIDASFSAVKIPARCVTPEIPVIRSH